MHTYKMTPEPDPPDPAYEGHGHTAPPNLSPWMYNSSSNFPGTQPPPKRAQKNTLTETHTHTTSLQTLGFSLTATHSLQVYPATAMHHYYDIWQWWSVLLLHISIWIYDDLFMQLLVTSFLSSFLQSLLNSHSRFIFLPFLMSCNKL